MLMGTAALTNARGKADESEILEVPADRLRQALAELPGVSETIVRAFIMRQQRLKRDREFAGLRILAQNDSQDGHRLDDFLDKNHVLHRLIVADESGIVVIRPHEAEDILARAEERCRKEAAMMDELRGGRTTMDLLGLDERANGD